MTIIKVTAYRPTHDDHTYHNPIHLRSDSKQATDRRCPMSVASVNVCPRLSKANWYEVHSMVTGRCALPARATRATSVSLAPPGSCRGIARGDQRRRRRTPRTAAARGMRRTTNKTRPRTRLPPTAHARVTYERNAANRNPISTDAPRVDAKDWTVANSRWSWLSDLLADEMPLARPAARLTEKLGDVGYATPSAYPPSFQAFCSRIKSRRAQHRAAASRYKLGSCE